jgi:hypothetical protein
MIKDVIMREMGARDTDTLAMAAAEVVETRKATSRKGRAPSAPRTLGGAPRPRAFSPE